MSQSRLLSIYINILQLLAGNKCQEEFLWLFTAYLQFVMSFVHSPLFYEGEQLSQGDLECQEFHQQLLPLDRSLELAALLSDSLPF